MPFRINPRIWVRAIILGNVHSKYEQLVRNIRLETTIFILDHLYRDLGFGPETLMFKILQTSRNAELTETQL
jgi:hypothetical protein